MQGDPFKTLFVGRLSYDVTEKRLRREFEEYGPIKSVSIVHNIKSGAPSWPMRFPIELLELNSCPAFAEGVEGGYPGARQWQLQRFAAALHTVLVFAVRLWTHLVRCGALLAGYAPCCRCCQATRRSPLLLPCPLSPHPACTITKLRLR